MDPNCCNFFVLIHFQYKKLSSAYTTIRINIPHRTNCEKVGKSKKGLPKTTKTKNGSISCFAFGSGIWAMATR
jgi:hypothetical protein